MLQQDAATLRDREGQHSPSQGLGSGLSSHVWGSMWLPVAGLDLEPVCFVESMYFLARQLPASRLAS